jgi:hypothetical protein
MEKKDLSDASLEEILYECASLRGVINVPHRALNEFNWFVQECLFGKFQDKYNSRMKELSPWNGRELKNWGLVFYDYCHEEYGS